MEWEEALEEAKRSVGNSVNGYFKNWDDIIEEAKYIMSEGREIEYDEYMLSEDWQYVRKQVFKRDSYKCKMCGLFASDCHHESYDNFGSGDWDEIDDCISLCHKCHNEIHNND
jgi:5-methylcytosine-specific restriction endonuclease McrA